MILFFPYFLLYMFNTYPALINDDVFKELTFEDLEYIRFMFISRNYN